jgi:hypothetical protein
MSQWQSVCLALLVSITSASTASPQAFTGGVEVQSGDVWLLPGDRVSPVAVVPQVSAGNGDVPTGDVWLSPDHQTIPSVTAQGLHPGDATVATRSE